MKWEILLLKNFLDYSQKMYSILVSDSSEFKKAKGVNKNVGAKINDNEYKNVLLNKKCLRHSMNRIQSKIHITETYEIDKFLCVVSW